MYDFAVDTDNISSLNSALDTASTGAKDGIDSTFTTLNGFDENTWSGDSYDTFKSGVEAYKPAMQTIPSVITAFKTHMETVANDEPGLESDILSAMNEIE